MQCRSSSIFSATATATAATAADAAITSITAAAAAVAAVDAVTDDYPPRCFYGRVRGDLFLVFFFFAFILLP